MRPAPLPARGGTQARLGGRKPGASWRKKTPLLPTRKPKPQRGKKKNRNGESKGLVLTEPGKAEEPVCRGGGQARPRGLKRRGAGPKVCVGEAPKPRPSRSGLVHAEHYPGKGRAKAREESRGTGPLPRTSRTSPAEGGARPPPAAAQRAPLPEAGLAEREVHGRRRVHKRRSPQPRAPSPPPRVVSPPPRGLRTPRARAGRPRPGGRRTRRSAESPPPGRPRAQCGLPFPAARASPGPGNKAGSARCRPPGRAADTHRELGRPPAGRARGCRARRGWAQGTGLGCSAAAAAGRKCGSETGREGRGAETAACAPPGPPPGMCVTSEPGRGNTDGSRCPGGWRGAAGSWARPVRGLNK